MKPLALLALLTLTACQGNQVSTGTQTIEEGCVASSAAIKVLTAANHAGKLSVAQQDGVLRAIGLITPVCSGPAVPTLDSAGQAAFLAAVRAIESNAARVKP